MISRYKDIYRIPSDGDEPLPPAGCTNFTITVLVPTNIVFTYKDCEGDNHNVTLNDESLTVCCQIGPTTAADPSKYTVEVGGDCGETE